MARESKRRRDERRFGKSDRMADHILTDDTAMIEVFHGSDKDTEWVAHHRNRMADSAMRCTIDATNVFEYARSIQETKELGFREMIVNAVPPFADCLVDFRVPRSCSPQVRNASWAIQCYRKGDEPELAYEGLLKVPSAAVYAECHWVIVGTLAMRMASGSPSQEGECGIICPLAQAVVMLGEKGASLQPPILAIDERWGDIGEFEWVNMWAHGTMFDCLLAFCFMNCKNVTTPIVEPDACLNRERHKAGLKPFLRYHTINIEPMKTVLRTEGGVEANGLKKALHICRGHFATYTPEKPLFGHFSGTVWKPSHTRGSFKQGVVVSDYNVKAPVSVETP